MQVSIRAIPTSDFTFSIGLVAFEFGSVRDPHEILQDPQRFRVWHVATETRENIADELRFALVDPHRGMLGRRGSLWMPDDTHAALSMLYPHRALPWSRQQEMDPATLLWAARRVPKVNFRVPLAPGLQVGNVLHEVVQQTVLLQAAFRALALNKSPG